MQLARLACPYGGEKSRGMTFHGLLRVRFGVFTDQRFLDSIFWLARAWVLTWFIASVRLSLRHCPSEDG